jgi:hypothetical protein
LILLVSHYSPQTQKAESTPGDCSLGDEIPLDDSGRDMELCHVNVNISWSLAARHYAALETQVLLDRADDDDEPLADAHPQDAGVADFVIAAHNFPPPVGPGKTLRPTGKEPTPPSQRGGKM